MNKNAKRVVLSGMAVIMMVSCGTAKKGGQSDTGVATFLSAYIKRPKIEHLIKMKLYRLVSGIVYGG